MVIFNVILFSFRYFLSVLECTIKDYDILQISYESMCLKYYSSPLIFKYKIIYRKIKYIIL